MKKPWPLFALFAALAVLALPVPAATAAGLAALSEPVRLTLLQAEGDQVGLLVRLAPGWKFYWRTPGEGGVPPSFDWSASQNLAAAAVNWPAPERIAIGDVDLYGYTGEVVLPIAIQRRDGTLPVDLVLSIEYGVCKDICILREDHLSHRLDPKDKAANPVNAALLAAWQARVPRPGRASGVRLLSREVSGSRMVLTLGSDQLFSTPDLFVEGAPGDWFSRPEVTISADRHQAAFAFTLAPPQAAKGPLTLTLVDGPRAVELSAAAPG
ncbi:MAG TPA: protein-disulfide reductase DsbD domain-containing protein [Ferrovibrio sp.]|uniref:protein-disulfide reductase DsbD domain-containing protein n=1 Tax=Ferrovibrio sp. TaxID=1917215 RepID=UPI002ED5AB8F